MVAEDITELAQENCTFPAFERSAPDGRVSRRLEKVAGILRRKKPRPMSLGEKSALKKPLLISLDEGLQICGLPSAKENAAKTVLRLRNYRIDLRCPALPQNHVHGSLDS